MCDSPMAIYNWNYGLVMVPWPVTWCQSIMTPHLRLFPCKEHESLSYATCTLCMLSPYPYPTLALSDLSGDVYFGTALSHGTDGIIDTWLCAGITTKRQTPLWTDPHWLFLPDTNLLPKCCPFELRSNGWFYLLIPDLSPALVNRSGQDHSSRFFPICSSLVTRLSNVLRSYVLVHLLVSTLLIPANPCLPDMWLDTKPGHLRYMYLVLDLFVSWITHVSLQSYCGWDLACLPRVCCSAPVWYDFACKPNNGISACLQGYTCCGHHSTVGLGSISWHCIMAHVLCSVC